MSVRLLSHQDSRLPHVSRPDPRPGGPQAPPIIELRGVGLRGVGQRRVGQRRVGQRGLPSLAQLDLLELTVWPGELVIVTGQPGSGRSALLNVLGLLDRPVTGTYLLKGIDTAKLRDRDRSALRGHLIGFVFQRKMLLPARSAIDNVTLPLRYTGIRGRQRLIRGLDSLDRVGLAAQAQLMTWQLSAGELALCAIARALVTDPGLLLCDDPTAGLDEATAARMIGLLAGLHREGRTVVIATADQLAAAYSSSSLRLGRPASDQLAGQAGLAGAVRDTVAITDSQTGLVP
jgi:putative ABC transport system ATP-binding protein